MADTSDSDYSFTSEISQHRRPTLRIQSGNKATLNFDRNYFGKGFIDLRNPSSDNVAYKVRTTAPASYMVRPSVGVIPPRAQRRIRLQYIHAEPLEEVAKRDPHEYLPLISKDKFMIQSMTVDSFAIPTAEMWADNSNLLLSQVLTVEFFYRSDILHERRYSAASRYTATSSFDGVASSSQFQSLVAHDKSQRVAIDKQETISTEASIPRPRLRKSFSSAASPGSGSRNDLSHLYDEGLELQRPPLNSGGVGRRQGAFSHRPSPIAEIPSRMLMSGEEESVKAAKESLRCPPEGGMGTFELSSESGASALDGGLSNREGIPARGDEEDEQAHAFWTPAVRDNEYETQWVENGVDRFGFRKSQTMSRVGSGTRCVEPGILENHETQQMDQISSRKVLRRLTEPYPMSHRVVVPEREANLAKVLERSNLAQTSTAETNPRTYAALKHEYHVLKETLEKRDEQMEILQKILETRMKMSSGSGDGGMSVRARIADKAIQCSLGGGTLSDGASARSSIVAGLILMVVVVGMAFLGLRSGAYQLEQLL